MKYNLKIIENFFDKNDFLALKGINFENSKDHEMRAFHNQIDKNNNIIQNTFDKDFLKNLHLKYHQKAINILRELNPEKVDLYDHSIFSIVKTGKNYKFPIQDDTPDKLLSGVIYLEPEENSGTIFYSNKNGDSKKTIPWKQNCGVFFSRKERETWHSYEGNKQSERIVLVYNLQTKQLKKVFEIEKKSYFYGMLRWKLNPTIFKYFKTLI